MKKRITILLLVLVVVFSTVLAGCSPAAPADTPPAEESPEAEDPAPVEEPEEPAEEPEEPADEETPDAEVVTSGAGELIVGTGTEPSGDLATPYWQNNATDNAIGALTSGYGTYELSRDAEIVLNETAVANVDIADSDTGGRVYTYTINDGLTYSDGSPITAKDYVANVLFFSSRQIVNLGATASAGQYIEGYGPFNRGESLTFSGVRLIDDMTFSVTLSPDYVPWFFETAYVGFGPIKLSAWLDTEDITVVDDGDGARFGFADEAADEEFITKMEVMTDEDFQEEEEFEEEQEAEAAGEDGEAAEEPAEEEDEDADEEEGEEAPAEEEEEEAPPIYVQAWSHLDYKEPIDKARTDVNRPVSGPYKPKSYDQASKTMVIEINPEFKGNHEGQVAQIPTLIFKYADSTTAIDQFKTGAIDLLQGQSSGTEINAGLDLVEEDPERYDYATYPRSGYGKLQFVADLYPTKDVEVRQAIAHLLDRNEFARAFTGGFGGVVNGPYGEGQWYYMKTKAELDGVLNNYPYDPEEAKTLLDSAGWNLDENGGEYSGEGLRYKENPETGELMPLVINWFSTENNPVSEQLVISLQENPDVAAAGMEIIQDTGDFTTLLNWMYRDGSQGEQFAVPHYHMFNLGSGLPATYLPTTEFTTDPDMLAAGYNTNFLVDEELYEAASTLGLVDPLDEEEFLQRYVKYITIWNKLLPDLPLYSNEYHDFFNAKLVDYEIDDLIGIDIALLYASLDE